MAMFQFLICILGAAYPKYFLHSDLFRFKNGLLPFLLLLCGNFCRKGTHFSLLEMILLSVGRCCYDVDSFVYFKCLVFYGFFHYSNTHSQHCPNCYVQYGATVVQLEKIKFEQIVVTRCVLNW